MVQRITPGYEIREALADNKITRGEYLGFSPEAQAELALALNGDLNLGVGEYLDLSTQTVQKEVVVPEFETRGYKFKKGFYRIFSHRNKYQKMLKNEQEVKAAAIKAEHEKAEAAHPDLVEERNRLQEQLSQPEKQLEFFDGLNSNPDNFIDELTSYYDNDDWEAPNGLSLVLTDGNLNGNLKSLIREYYDYQRKIDEIEFDIKMFEDNEISWLEKEKNQILRSRKGHNDVNDGMEEELNRLEKELEEKKERIAELQAKKEFNISKKEGMRSKMVDASYEFVNENVSYYNNTKKKVDSIRNEINQINAKIYGYRYVDVNEEKLDAMKWML